MIRIILDFGSFLVTLGPPGPSKAPRPPGPHQGSQTQPNSTMDPIEQLCFSHRNDLEHFGFCVIFGPPRDPQGPPGPPGGPCGPPGPSRLIHTPPYIICNNFAFLIKMIRIILEFGSFWVILRPPGALQGPPGPPETPQGPLNSPKPHHVPYRITLLFWPK